MDPLTGTYCLMPTDDIRNLFPLVPFDNDSFIFFCHVCHRWFAFVERFLFSEMLATDNVQEYKHSRPPFNENVVKISDRHEA